MDKPQHPYEVQGRRAGLKTPARMHELHTDGKANWIGCESCEDYFDEVCKPALEEYEADKRAYTEWVHEQAEARAGIERSVSDGTTLREMLAKQTNGKK
jgi:hypothetical protein